MYGAGRLQSELASLGYNAERRVVGEQEFVIIADFEVPAGRFAGRQISLGLPAPTNYPISVGSALHVRAEPQLLEKQSIPDVRNITDSVLGVDWCYWSINFHWSGERERSTARLLAKINRVFANA